MVLAWFRLLGLYTRIRRVRLSELKRRWFLTAEDSLERPWIESERTTIRL